MMRFSRGIFLILLFALFTLTAGACNWFDAPSQQPSLPQDNTALVNLNSSQSGESTFSRDVCKQFPADRMEKILGLPIVKAQASEVRGVASCRYYTSTIDIGGNRYIALTLSETNPKEYKRQKEAFTFTVQADERIGVANYVVRRPDGVISEIDLLTSDTQFMSIERSPGKILSDEGLIEFAAKFAQVLTSS